MPPWAWSPRRCRTASRPWRRRRSRTPGSHRRGPPRAGRPGPRRCGRGPGPHRRAGRSSSLDPPFDSGESRPVAPWMGRGCDAVGNAAALSRVSTGTGGSPMVNPVMDVRRADTRPHTRIGWLDSHHSFSFGHHYDPANTGHGLLLVSNDDRVAAGTGFSTHPHQDMEIVTWVLSGRLEHRGLRGQPRRAVSRPGPTHERRDGHLALGDEPVEGRGRALRPDVGASRHGACRSVL